MTYLLAWGIALAAGALGSVGLFFLTRNLSGSFLRWWLRLLAPFVMLVPAPVPGYDNYAPAFIVFLFESLFQRNGEPFLAGLILGAAALMATLLAWLACRRKISEIKSDSHPN